MTLLLTARELSLMEGGMDSTSSYPLTQFYSTVCFNFRGKNGVTFCCSYLVMGALFIIPSSGNIFYYQIM